MEGLQEDGSPLEKGEPPDEFYWLHQLFRLHGIPIHESYQWDEEAKRVMILSISLQLKEEQERLSHGIGRVM